MDYEKERIHAECDRAGNSRPYAGHDARMAEGAKAVRTTLGGTQTVRARSPLEDVSDRVQSLNGFVCRVTENLTEVGHKLRNHADSVYGQLPETDEPEALRQAILEQCPYYGGALGEVHAQLHGLEEVLHRLDRALTYCAVQAGRNCTLA